MTKSLTLSDVLGLGFMTFAFYLGAGNIIFPPLAGFMAGEHLSLAMLGFLVTAVGLPLITIIAVAKAGNGWAGMTKLLPAGVATDISNGGAIVNAYVLSLFGQPGQFILAAIITLACFTTAVGLISACSDFFHNLTGMSYKKLVVLLGVICAVVANVGLSQLISLSIPVLVAIYPVAVALVLVTFLKGYFGRPRLVFRAVLMVAFLLWRGLRWVSRRRLETEH